uniref:NAD(P)-binding domain-containing protein n=1 Tax=Paramormyrops kingsleyae TaxID=1676925 RepID=A0A3B3QUD8_9TELE
MINILNRCYIIVVLGALPHDHVITAIVRYPGKMITIHENLKGDIFSENNLKFHFTVVISCLGLSPSWWFGVTGYTTSMKAVDSAMHEVMVNRENPSGTESPFLIHFLLLPIIRSVLMNMYEMEQYLKMEYINWTVVRLAGLRNESATSSVVVLSSPANQESGAACVDLQIQSLLLTHQRLMRNTEHWLNYRSVIGVIKAT